MNERDVIKGNGWHFGSIFTESSAPNLVASIPEDLKSEDGIYISVVHDCSIVQGSFTKEPFLEFFAARIITKLNSSYTNIKNIRCLHTTIIQNDEEAVLIELNMSHRGFICRGPIMTDCADPTLAFSVDDLNLLKRWLSQRYISVSFPDQFNELIGPLVKDKKGPLLNLLDSPVGRQCHSIYISITPSDRDLNEGEEYGVDLLFTFKEAIAEQIDDDKLDEFQENVKSCLNEATRINAREIIAVSEGDVDYPTLTKMVRWQFPDYLSLKEDAETTPLNLLS